MQHNNHNHFLTLKRQVTYATHNTPYFHLPEFCNWLGIHKFAYLHPAMTKPLEPSSRSRHSHVGMGE